MVLVAGGHQLHYPIASAERFDPVTGTWSPTGSLGSPRTSHAATLLPNGVVLVTGGYGGVSGVGGFFKFTGTADGELYW
jgi:hypothetical protein